MVIHVKSSQVQQEFGSILDRTLSEGEVVVERYGKPRVVIIEYRRYLQLIEVEKQLLHNRLREASAAASKRAAHLSDDEVDQLIERARSESYEERRAG